MNEISIAPFFYNQNKVTKSITCFSTLLFSIKKKKTKKQMDVWTHGLIRYVPMVTWWLNIYLPIGDLYKRLQQNMLHFPFNSNVNLWVKIHLIYEEMFSRILIKLRSYLLFCDMQSSCFSIFEYDHVQLFKNINAKKFCKFFNTIQGKLFLF